MRFPYVASLSTFVFVLSTMTSCVFLEEKTSISTSYKKSQKPLLEGLFSDTSGSNSTKKAQEPLFDQWAKKKKTSSAGSNTQTKKTNYVTTSKRKSNPNNSYNPPPTTSKKIYGVRTTAYCHLENEPGAVGNLNAIGTALRFGSIRSAAADWSRYPLGTQFRIVGEPHLYEIDDYGSALVGNGTIDFYKPTLSMMNNWGLRYVDIEIVKWGCYHRSLKYLPASSGYWHVRQMHYVIKGKINSYSSNQHRASKLFTKEVPAAMRRRSDVLRMAIKAKLAE